MQPLKRCIELQPLSRQHHNGLLFCFFIEKGIKKHADKILMRDFCMYFWESDLQHHFEIEETYLTPFSSYPELREVINKMLADHIYIRKFFENPNILTEESIFDQLRQLVDDHIRFEERELYSLIQSVITAEEMQTLGATFAMEENNMCTSYPIKFWE